VVADVLGQAGDLDRLVAVRPGLVDQRPQEADPLAAQESPSG
jgi:hypothetical protein